MAGDPRRDVRIGSGGRGRMDGPPSWVESYVAGRSRAEREADQDMMVRGMVLIGAVVGLVLLGLSAMFEMVGLQFGIWSFPAFVPLLVWAFGCAVSGHVWRPVEFDLLRWPERLKAAAVLLVVMWLVWPLWSGPTVKAWRADHGGFVSVRLTGTPSFPLHAALGSSPIAMGLVAFILLAVGMVLAPNGQRRRERRGPDWPGPPGGPEPLRAPLASRSRPESPGPEPLLRPMPPRPRDPRWP
ncbi:MAG: hypothetical protein WBV77_05645 [Solirubrobacteraceae bacterium]